MDRTIASRLASGSEELLVALLDSTVAGVYAVDGEGRVLFTDPAVLAMLGYEGEDELLGRDSHATIQYRYPEHRSRSPIACCCGQRAAQPSAPRARAPQG